VSRFERTRGGVLSDGDRQRLAGFALIVRLDDRYGRDALGQKLAGGAVVVMMVGGWGRHVGRGMLGMAGVMMPTVRDMLGRVFVLVIV
jgi:hypothetical protein